MNVNTIEISKDEALMKLTQYKALNAKQKTFEDRRLQSLYQAVSKGNSRVINVTEAFRQTGLNDKGEPRLAIARADWKTVYFYPERTFRWTQEGNRRTYNSWQRVTGAGSFTDMPQFQEGAYSKTIALPGETFPNGLVTKNLRSSVPHIPPNIRPQIALSNFHILFEVENWKTYPVDPYLLRRIEGNLFVVVAEWELTDLEAMLLGSMTGN